MKHSPVTSLQNLFFSAIMLSTLLFLAGCKKGDTGPEGNANVKSGTVILTNTSWLYPGTWMIKPAVNTSVSYSTRYADINTPLITEDVVKNGMVLVYFNPASDNTFTPLPYTFESITYYYNFAFEYKAGNIRLHFYYSSNASGGALPALNTTTIKDYTIKYIVVAGALGMKMKKDGVNITDYAAVMKYMNK